MKSAIVTIIAAVLVMNFSLRIINAGTVIENAAVLLDSRDCALAASLGAPIKDCEVTATVTTNFITDEYKLTFANGASFSLDQKSVRSMSYSTDNFHYTAWGKLAVFLMGLLFVVVIASFIYQISNAVKRIRKIQNQ